MSGVTCSVEPASAPAAAPADWHHEGGLRETELAVPIGSLAIVIVDHDDKSPAAHCFERMLECGKSGWLWKNGRANGFDIFTVSKPSMMGRVNHRAALTITPA